jgi:hypothetical protein
MGEVDGAAESTKRRWNIVAELIVSGVDLAIILRSLLVLFVKKRTWLLD